MKLFIDFDDTIVETMRTYCTTYNHLYKNHPDYKFADYTKVKHWDFREICPLTVDNPNEIFENENFFKFATFYYDVRKVLKKLNEKFEIYIITIGTPKNIELKTRWIAEHLPFIENSIFLYNKSIKMDKSIIDMSDGILIDDHQNNLFNSNAMGKICFNGSGRKLPWNKDWNGIKVNTWVELEEILIV